MPSFAFPLRRVVALIALARSARPWRLAIPEPPARCPACGTALPFPPSATADARLPCESCADD